MSYKYLVSILFLFITTKKRTIKFFFSLFFIQLHIVLVLFFSKFSIFYPLSQIETTCSRVTRLILAWGKCTVNLCIIDH